VSREGSATGSAIPARSTGDTIIVMTRVGHDGPMTQPERMQMIVFALGMLVAAGLSIKAGVSGVFDLPPPDRSRVQTLLAPMS
jgi:hypothetical protein